MSITSKLSLFQGPKAQKAWGRKYVNSHSKRRSWVPPSRADPDSAIETELTTALIMQALLATTFSGPGYEHYRHILLLFKEQIQKLYFQALSRATSKALTLTV